MQKQYILTEKKNIMHKINSFLQKAKNKSIHSRLIRYKRSKMAHDRQIYNLKQHKIRSAMEDGNSKNHTILNDILLSTINSRPITY